MHSWPWGGWHYQHVTGGTTVPALLGVILRPASATRLVCAFLPSGSLHPLIAVSGTYHQQE